MRFTVEILDKPFSQLCSRSNGQYQREPVLVETKQTARLTFFCDEGLMEEKAEYGYRSSEEIQEMIDKQRVVDLNYCYVTDVVFGDQEIVSIKATDAIFSSNTSFIKTSIIGEACFNNAMFFGGVPFICAKFNSSALFQGANFYGGAFFSHAVFKSVTNFEFADFNEDAHFSFAKFSNDADFSNVIFNREADFFSAEVDTTIRFTDVKFLSNSDLRFTLCRRLNLNECTFSGICNISSTSGFECLLFKECRSLGSFYIPFNTAIKKSIRDGLFSEKACDENPYYRFRDIEYETDNHAIYRELAYEFNFLKVNYSKNGEYEWEDQAYVEYRRCMRKTTDFIFRVFEWFVLDFLSCYCTKPAHVFYASILAITVFAGLFSIPGTVDFSGHYQGFWGSVYHSVITFFTIGYGDSCPMGWLGLLLTGMEGFVGVFLMSLFTVSFSRTALR